MTYDTVFSQRATQLGKEIDRLIEGDIRYSESLPFPEFARQRLYHKVLRLETEWSKNE